MHHGRLAILRIGIGAELGFLIVRGIDGLDAKLLLLSVVSGHDDDEEEDGVSVLERLV